MNKEQQELKRFLEQHVEWCKRQDSKLEMLENKLYEMKEIAEYARDHELLPIDRERLQEQLDILEQEVHSLEQQLHFEIN